MKVESILSEARARARLESLQRRPSLGVGESELEMDLRFAVDLVDVMGWTWPRVLKTAERLGGMRSYRRKMQALLAPE